MFVKSEGVEKMMSFNFLYTLYISRTDICNNYSFFLLYAHGSKTYDTWAASSEFVSSSIPSWQIITANAQPSRGARDLAFCLKVPLDSLLVWASNGGSGETARMRRLAWTFAARIGDKYQIRLSRPTWYTSLQTQILDVRITVVFYSLCTHVGWLSSTKVQIRTILSLGAQ